MSSLPRTHVEYSRCSDACLQPQQWGGRQARCLDCLVCFRSVRGTWRMSGSSSSGLSVYTCTYLCSGLHIHSVMDWKWVKLYFARLPSGNEFCYFDICAQMARLSSAHSSDATPATGSALPVTLPPPICHGKAQSHLHLGRRGLRAAVAPQEDRVPREHGVNKGCPTVILSALISSSLTIKFLLRKLKPLWFHFLCLWYSVCKWKQSTEDPVGWFHPYEIQ